MSAQILRDIAALKQQQEKILEVLTDALFRLEKLEYKRPVGRPPKEKSNEQPNG